LGLLLKNKFQDYDGAKASYGRAIKADPNSATAHYNLGLLLADKFQDYDSAKASYGRAIKADPNHAGAINNLGVLLHLNIKDYEGAEVLYHRALKVDPRHKMANASLGILFEDTERYPEAESQYLKTLSMHPDFHAVRYRLANMLSNTLSRWPDAATHMQIAADGGFEEAQTALAEYKQKAADAQ
jgi:tetratricopeptide (TPR) repeat protein